MFRFSYIQIQRTLIHPFWGRPTAIPLFVDVAARPGGERSAENGAVRWYLSAAERATRIRLTCPVAFEFGTRSSIEAGIIRPAKHPGKPGRNHRGWRR